MDFQEYPADLTALLDIHLKLGELFYDKALALYLNGEASESVNYAFSALAHYRHAESVDDLKATEVIIPFNCLPEFDMAAQLKIAREFAIKLLDDKRWAESEAWKCIESTREYFRIKQWKAMEQYFCAKLYK